MKTAVGYVRCSTELQEESPEQQKREILTFAERNGYKIVDWYTDFGISGTTFGKRPGFLRLKEAVEAGAQFQTVICYDESRWGRAIEADENTYWRVHFRIKGVDVVLVKTSIDPKHVYAPMLTSFESIQASQFSKKLSELTLRGARNNGRYSNGGTAPYGYKRVAVELRSGEKRDLENGKRCVKGQEKVQWELGDPKEVEIVVSIFTERLCGTAYVNIAEKLNGLGVPCPQRGRWRNRDQKWSGVTIKAILENPAYYGVRAYNRNSMSKIQAQAQGRQIDATVNYPHWRNNPSEWCVEEAAHIAIIEKDKWLSVQATNKADRQVKKNQHVIRGEYLLSGLVRCSRCGFPFQGNSARAKGRAYFRYIDGGWNNKRVCSFYSMPKEKLESIVVMAVSETMTDPVVISKIEEHVGRLLQGFPGSCVQEFERIRTALRQLNQKKKNITEAIELGRSGSTVATLIERLEKLEEEAAILDREMRTVSMEQVQNQRIQRDIGAIREFMQDFDQALSHAYPHEKKQLLQKCISRIIIDRDNGVLDLSIRLLPAATAEIERIYQNKTAPTTEVVGAESSGDSRRRMCEVV